MVKLEVFSGDPPCPGCVALVELAEKVALKYAGELELDWPRRSGLGRIRHRQRPRARHRRPGEVCGAGSQ